MITKDCLFLVRTDEDSIRAQNIMESIAGSDDPTHIEIFDIFKALIHDWYIRNLKTDVKKIEREGSLEESPLQKHERGKP
jgi:hypothetical protein